MRGNLCSMIIIQLHHWKELESLDITSIEKIRRNWKDLTLDGKRWKVLALDEKRWKVLALDEKKWKVLALRQ
ncbi:hypothetical protein RclHR1_17410003 [Rhizophagus clarus]|uniref:Uncharacterized protein n=1 Tax=Rhizophagus clarus TaxID=94130 RepID=A0A2Z6QK33_9GLOM|nr:hypothetical protein RclHR1_17410003 [Rhizophagus clarus]